MTDVVLDPMLAESIEAGAIGYVAQWLANEGDHVHAGQVLARAMLVGVCIDVTASHAGIVEEILVPAGENFARGAVLARLIAA